MTRMWPHCSLLVYLSLAMWPGLALANYCENNLPATNPDEVYIDHGDGTVTDTRTDLMWKKCDEGLSGAGCEVGSVLDFTWSMALRKAKASTFAGYSDWRLPNVRELSTLVEECRWLPAINTNLFPNTAPTLNFHWSSSRYAPAVDRAWFVVLSADGNAVGHTGLLNARMLVRLVRGGE